MLFRYRARNFPSTLNQQESERWEQQRLQRLQQPADNRQLTPESFKQEVLAARQAREGDSHAQAILDRLVAWIEELGVHQ